MASKTQSDRVSISLRRLLHLGLSCALLSSLLLTVGCFRRSVAVPGVFDMRTDGSGESRDLPRKPYASERRGFEGILQGRGAKMVGDRVVIEDRAYWVIGAIPAVSGDIPGAFNDVAKASPGGLRDVRIGEQFMLMDWGISFVSRLLFAPASWVTPPFTFIASGTPIRGSDSRGTTARPEREYGRAPAPPTAPPTAPAVPPPAPRPSETPPPATFEEDPLDLPSSGLPPPDELSPDEFGADPDPGETP